MELFFQPSFSLGEEGGEKIQVIKKRESEGKGAKRRILNSMVVLNILQ